MLSGAHHGTSAGRHRHPGRIAVRPTGNVDAVVDVVNKLGESISESSEANSSAGLVTVVALDPLGLPRQQAAGPEVRLS